MNKFNIGDKVVTIKTCFRMVCVLNFVMVVCTYIDGYFTNISPAGEWVGISF